MALVPVPVVAAERVAVAAAAEAGADDDWPMICVATPTAGDPATAADMMEMRARRRCPPCRHVHALLHQKAEELDRKLEDRLTLRGRTRDSIKA